MMWVGKEDAGECSLVSPLAPVSLETQATLGTTPGTWKKQMGKKRRQMQEPFSWGLHLVKEGRGWVGYSGSLSQLLRLLERSMKRGG